MTLAWAIYLALGAVAGVLAGLLGIGGGLVLVAALVWLLPSQGVPAELAVHAALATALASIVMTGLSSARSHHLRGSVLWRTAAWLVPGTAQREFRIGRASVARRSLGATRLGPAMSAVHANRVT